MCIEFATNLYPLLAFLFEKKRKRVLLLVACVHYWSYIFAHEVRTNSDRDGVIAAGRVAESGASVASREVKGMRWAEAAPKDIMSSPGDHREAMASSMLAIFHNSYKDPVFSKCEYHKTTTKSTHPFDSTPVYVSATTCKTLILSPQMSTSSMDYMAPGQSQETQK